jgi:hypothetical protein
VRAVRLALGPRHPCGAMRANLTSNEWSVKMTRIAAMLAFVFAILRNALLLAGLLAVFTTEVCAQQAEPPAQDSADTSGALAAIQQALQKVDDDARKLDQSQVKEIQRKLAAESQTKNDSEIARDAAKDTASDLLSTNPPTLLDALKAGLSASQPSNTAAPSLDEVNQLTPQQQQEILQNWKQYCGAQQNLSQAVKQNINGFDLYTPRAPSPSEVQNAGGPQIVAPESSVSAQWNPPCPSPSMSSQFFTYLNSWLFQMANPYRFNPTPGSSQAVTPQLSRTAQNGGKAQQPAKSSPPCSHPGCVAP